MKICHMTSAHNSNDTRIFYKECVSLAKAGYETYLIAAGESRYEKGVHVLGVGPRPEGRLSRMTRTTRKVYERAFELNADVYHLHDPELLPYGVKLADRGYKVVFDSHEEYMHLIDNKTYIPSFIRSTVSTLFRSYYKTALPRFATVIIVTPNQKKYLKGYCKHICMVTNYPIIDEEEEQPCEKARYTSNKLVFAGGVSDQWCHKEVLEALNECADVSYVLCGGGNDKYIELLKNMDTWGQVDFLGKVSHKKVGMILEGCAVGLALCKPSVNSDGRVGTLGNTKLFEEMNAGLPVICTDFELWKEIIDKYQCGLYVDPLNNEQIVNAIGYLTKNPDIAERMGNNGKSAVREEFNWATQERVLLKLYSELLADQ